MTGEPRVIVYGVGAMGSIITRLLLDKGAQIVGAVANSPGKIGRDLGDVAGLGQAIGVTVEASPRRALEEGADIAVVCVSSYLKAMRDHFAVCLEHGVNVVTAEEETVYQVAWLSFRWLFGRFEERHWRKLLFFAIATRQVCRGSS